MPESDQPNNDANDEVRKEILLRLADRIEAGVAGKLDLVSLFRMLDIDEPVVWFARHGNPIENIEAAGQLMKSVLSEDEARDALTICLTNAAGDAGPGLFLSQGLRLIASRPVG